MKKISRRRFWGTATVVTAGGGATWWAKSVIERVGVAVLGCGRGGVLARHFSQLADSQVVAVCDPDENRGKRLCDKIASISGKRPPYVTDFRRLLDSKDVDALAIATPDHWHAPATLLACLASKDAYVEKPVSHNIIEGRLAVEAAKKYGRIIQTGTNLRSTPHYREAWQLLSDGVIGKVLMVKAISNHRIERMEPRRDEDVPRGVDYDLWLGPARKRPFNRNRFHDTWHWSWEYGTGDIGNDGVHQIDIGRWALGLTVPHAVSCSAAKLRSKGDAQETPDCMMVTWEFDDVLFVYEQRNFAYYQMQGHRSENDNIFYGQDGYMMIDRDGYRVFYNDGAGPAFQQDWSETPHHCQNFIECVKSRDRQALAADIQEGHNSTLLCHLGNIAYRTGRRLTFDAETESFANDDEANRYLGREYRKGYELPRI